jgi:hypothetical protein
MIEYPDWVIKSYKLDVSPSSQAKAKELVAGIWDQLMDTYPAKPNQVYKRREHEVLGFTVDQKAKAEMISAMALPIGVENEGISQRIISSQLKYILEVLEDTEGKKILVLGCGSSYPENYSCDRREFEPWLCRAIHYLGIDVIGVDIRTLEGEQFEHYRADLSKTGSLSFLGDHSIDLACEYKLFDSPTLPRLGVREKTIVETVLGEVEPKLRSGSVFLRGTYEYGDPLPWEKK